MEDNLPVEQPETVAGRPCANCGQPALEGDHPTALCLDCRNHFTRLSIPLWIKIFAAGIAVVFLFSLFSFPRNLTTGLHLQRGEKAMEDGNYNTAEKELQKTLESAPGSEEANGNLIIAAFYNQDYQTMAAQVKKMEHVNFEDKALYSKITVTLDRADRYFPSDSFNTFTQAHPGGPPAYGDTAWTNYLRSHPEDCYALMGYASIAFDHENYVLCDSLLQKVLRVDDGYYSALAMETSTQRELGNMDASLGYAKRILAINHESAYGMATEARTLLRQKKDRSALELAQKAVKLQPKEMYAQATLALAWHFNGNSTERDTLLRRAHTAAVDSSERVTIQYVEDVISKKVPFRN
jgi:tetratricopeptide (TPR) repeat protein